MDALNGKAFVDDKQVVALTASKMYTNDAPRTVVRLEQLLGRSDDSPLPPTSAGSLEHVGDLR